MKKFNLLRKAAWVTSAVLILSSCESDVWKEHYSTGDDVPTKNLAETIESMPEYSNFVKALKTTYMFNGDKQLVKTYWDLLNESQYLTVWLPSNDAISAEKWAEYTNSDMDSKDHLKVGEELIMNHIARFSHTVGASTKEKITMLSEKSYRSNPDNISDVQYMEKGTNIRCVNGILHKLDGKIDYLPSIYEYLVTAPEYRDFFGKWLEQYTKLEIDENKSVASGVNDEGNMEYVDSVMIEKSIIMDKFGFINSEDSTYAVILPSPELFRERYDSISKFYEYGEVQPGRDSLQQFYTFYAMMTDMFFNMSETGQKSPEDSIVSTLFDKSERMREHLPYHVYYKPFESDGIIGRSSSQVNCSNGEVYIVDEWPFVDSLTFLRPIKIQAEDVRLSGMVLNQRTVYLTDEDGKMIGMTRVMDISKEGVKNWDAIYQVDNNLKGKYTVNLVFCPNQNDPRPYYLSPVVKYRVDSEAEVLYEHKITVGRRKVNAPFEVCLNQKPDTIVTDAVEFKTCNYKTNVSRASVTLTSSISDNNVDKYSPNVWLDYIELRPVIE